MSFTCEQADAVIEACARAAHEANRAYCLATGDASQVPWDQAPGWQTQSAKKGVALALDLAAEIDRSGDSSSIGDVPEKLHDSWVRDKVADGWVFGPVKDAAAKTHPAMKPYAELPKEQRAKDELFFSVVVAMKHALDAVLS